MLKLGFHYHIPSIQAGPDIKMPGYQGRFIDSLAAHCNRITCFLHNPVNGEIANMDYTIQSNNVRLVDIGPHASVPYRTLFARRFSAPLRAKRGELDVVLLRGPSPLLPAMARSAGKTPVALLLVSDYLAGVDDLPQPRWRKEAIHLWSRWNQKRQLDVARGALTFVNSHKLYQELLPHVPNLVETRTTTLNQADFFEREDTCHFRPIRLLYTGRMEHEKGILEIIEALALIVHEGHDVVLDLVGMHDKRKSVVKELQIKAEALGISDRVIYHGYKALGPQLFEHYRKADIYVIASKSSEGFPRTIWEAFSQSTPVIATKVGSIPMYLHHEKDALLAIPNRPEELASQIRRILTEPELRKRIILNGRKLAKENTLDIRAKEMVENIETWLRYEWNVK